ncbi:MAG: histidine triad nucleotide-binding protein [Eubacterium aggregans]|uniref:Histidine triad (HIT) family protein n=1 Tax=Eubacterium aggregans TaxID=81409 RepID=A0A1H3XMP6_9FIRM|nr:histidine triad nucleotide-binding protein [Eubacterium aggregans]MDD4691501.1 histidine triad nucleotide-binding protein [Eubacterium aggregans]MEA5072672.1 histidine triad nucleotide-binding protein [Eubacterium aggregans]SEA00735.1 histidine triad (HIT) family protein [Eubacterium aggregans]
MAEDCLFCKIAAGEIPATVVYEDDAVLAFKDIAPQAPVHVVIIPKEHYDSILSVPAGDDIISHIHTVANRIVLKLGIADDGFRLVNNCGEAGGQTVPHLHYHLLGGRNMEWPPG